MDKFAVDLEKVLDDFEFNEGREEAVVSSVIKASLQHIRQKPLRTPACNYRRASFEPINLADADFAASPIPSATSFNKSVKSSNFKESFVELDSKPTSQNVKSLIPVVSSSEILENVPTSEEVSNEVNDCCEIILENHSSSSEDTPDLLDTNTLKINLNNSNFNITNESNTQLPDITSIRNTPIISNAEENGEQVAFDLIKSNTSIGENLSNSLENLPLIVSVSTGIKEPILGVSMKPISFDPVCDIPDSELVDYLQSLEDLESNDSATNFKLDSSKSLYENKILESVGKLTESSNCVENKSEDTENEANCISELSNICTKEIESTLEINTDFGKSVQYIEQISEVQCSSNCDEQIQTSVPILSLEETVGLASSSKQIQEVDDKDITSFKEVELHCIEQSSLQNIETIGTENEEIENSQNEEKAVLNGQEMNQEVTDDYGDGISKVYFNPASNSSEVHSSEESAKPLRPNTLPIVSHVITDSEESPTPTGNRGNCLENVIQSPEEQSLGKVAPFWVPDTEAESCMQCHNKFTVLKRRHHCRACGLVLCSKCCSLKAPLEYMEFQEVRVCQPCFNIIYRVANSNASYNLVGSGVRQPNPNNPMEYCSTIPPLQQAAKALLQPPPSVLVPTGVLKREGRTKSDVPKQVMFSDGIRPGGDLTELDGVQESRVLPRRGVRRLATPPGGGKGMSGVSSSNILRRPLNPTTQSFIPNDPNLLPPVVNVHYGQLSFIDLISEVTDKPVKFALNYNLFVHVKKVKLDCCVNRECWSVCSDGLACFGQDEIAMVLECLPGENLPPQDIFHLVNILHQDAAKGSTMNEMCFTPSFSSNLLGSKDHGGFLYIRPTLQCTTQLLLPPQPYLFAVLVHRWETPWARLFPLRLILRLGAEYRYYPTTLVSFRNRPPLYTDIGHTIMKILVDFRKFSYTLPIVRGLLIHVENRQTSILIPRNRYDQVVRALNSASENVIAFGANLSLEADSHLICIQGTQDENTYHTQAINIHNKPRKVTGASFVVFNGALKAAGLSGKSSIIEDGLVVHLPSDSLIELKKMLCEMKDYTISCGPNREETVLLKWTEDDMNFNIGVKSCIDGQTLDGVPSIRVHNGTDYPNHTKIIRWTEVFILQSDESSKGGDPLDISKVSESLARATCIALVPFLEALAEVNLTVIGVRATIHHENVGYEAGGLGRRLPSQYMKRLDDELIPVVNEAAINSNQGDSTATCTPPAILELIFRIMNHT